MTGSIARRLPGLRPLPILLGSMAGLGLLSCQGRSLERRAGKPWGGAVTAGAPTTEPLHIDGMYLTQGTQRLDQSVPLVQGRAGWLRVFATARDWSGPAPAARVRIQGPDGGPLLETAIPGPGTVPRVVDEAAPGASWNLRIPGRLVQPGNTVLVRLDPPPPGVAAGGLTWPRNGRPMPLTVVAVAPLRIALIPVRARGLTGQVLGGGRTLQTWRAPLFLEFPLNEIDLAPGPVYATTQALDSPRSAFRLLCELEAARLASGRSDTVHFYGVCPSVSGAGSWRLAGLASIPPDQPGPFGRTALGSDAIGQPEGLNGTDTFLHELGHGLGLRHAPGGAGGPSGPVDPLFPYPDGGIGACGFNLRDASPRDPAKYKDLMSSRQPQWTSDYDWKRILAYRTGEPRGREPVPPAAQDCLLVRGIFQDGRIRLEAAFRVRRPPLLPEPGDFVLSALESRGHALANVPFALQLAEDLPGSQPMGSFAFVLPLSQARQDSLALLRVTRGDQVLAELGAAPAGAGSLKPSAARDARGLVQLQWDPQSFPEVLVRDPRTGAVLAMGPGPRLELETPVPELECLFSDGLHTQVHRVRVAP